MKKRNIVVAGLIGLSLIGCSTNKNLEKKSELTETLTKTFSLGNQVNNFDLSTSKLTRYFQVESFKKEDKKNIDSSIGINYKFAPNHSNNENIAQVLDSEYLVVKNLKKCSDKDIDIFEIEKTNEQISICENEKQEGMVILTLLSR